jgi:hypothetical protein
MPETWKCGLIGSETVTLFWFRPPRPGPPPPGQSQRAKRALGPDIKSLLECFRTGQLELLETAETFGTGFSRGTAGTIWNRLLLDVFQAIAGLDPQVKRKFPSDNPRDLKHHSLPKRRYSFWYGVKAGNRGSQLFSLPRIAVQTAPSVGHADTCL